MTEYQCPARICAMFIDGDEKANSDARSKAVVWMTGLKLNIGDTILMPDPDTGDLSVLLVKAEGVA
jgi:hypothetical protein